MSSAHKSPHKKRVIRGKSALAAAEPAPKKPPKPEAVRNLVRIIARETYLAHARGDD